MKTRKPELVPALCALACAGLAVLMVAAGLYWVASAFTAAAAVWTWNL